MTTALKWIAFFCGLAVVGWVAADTDLAAVIADVTHLGGLGAVATLIVFYVGFAADAAAWAMMFETRVGLARVYLVQTVGEAVNTLMPFGSLGGEPVKAMVLKRRYGVTYRESTATLLLAQAINTLAEVPFIGFGLTLVLAAGILPPLAETAMIVGAACVSGFIVLLFAMLHLRLLIRIEQRLAAGRWGEKLHRALGLVRDVEQRLFTFVRHRPLQFAAALGLSFVTWLSGAVEVYVILRFLGANVTFQDAWMVEAAVVLARNATFFIPAHMGSQDGATMLVAGALTGSPELGLALALVRRGREIFTSSIGLALGAWLGLKPGALEREVQDGQHDQDDAGKDIAEPPRANAVVNIKESI